MQFVTLSRLLGSLAAVCMLVGSISVASAQTALINGGVVTGTTANGQTTVYRLTASAGDHVTLQVADTSSNDQYLFVDVWSAQGGGMVCRGKGIVLCSFTASPSGSTLVSVGASYEGGSGSYAVYFARAGAREGGTLPNGGSVHGTIEPGDIDSFTFTGRSGETALLRAVKKSTNAFRPRLSVIGPSGALVADQSPEGWDVVPIELTLSATGAYTVLLTDATAADADIGEYSLYFTKAAGANEGGTLAPSGSLIGGIDKGDIDSWQIPLAAGQMLRLQVGDTARGAFVPRIIVCNPQGAPVADAQGADVASVGFRATASGTHTVMVADASFAPSPSAGGTYEMYVTRVLGANEGGSLGNAAAIEGHIDLADIDSFTFTTKVNDAIHLRLITTIPSPSFPPYFELFGPNGELLQTVYGNGVGVASYLGTALLAGAHTVLVYDGATYSHAGSWPYTLQYAHGPGANEGGVLNNDAFVQGRIDKGDFDSFSFVATTGNSVAMQVADTSRTAFAPALFLYAPNGSLVASDIDKDVAFFETAVPTTGTYTVIIADGSAEGGASGNYDVFYQRAPGTNEGGAIPNGGMVVGRIDRGDLDSFTFYGKAGAYAQLSFVDVNRSAFMPRYEVFDPQGVSMGGFRANDVGVLGRSLPKTGMYSIRLRDESSVNIGDYQIYLASPPIAADGTLFNGMPRTGTIDRGDIDSFAFAGRAGQTARLEVVDSGSGGSLFLPIIWLFDGAGQYITRSSGESNVVSATLPSNGTYTVLIVDGSLYPNTIESGIGSGNYSVLLTGSGATALQ